MNKAETDDLWRRADEAVARTLAHRAQQESRSRRLSNDDLPWAREIWEKLPASVKDGVTGIRVPLSGTRILLLQGGEGVRRTSLRSTEKGVRRAAFL